MRENGDEVKGLTSISRLINELILLLYMIPPGG